MYLFDTFAKISYVPFTLQRIGQRDNSYRLPAARIPLRFAQCPCTQTAIRAGAVNHPHHINCANHSSNKCQPALRIAIALLPPAQRPPRQHLLHRGQPKQPAATTGANARDLDRPTFTGQKPPAGRCTTTHATTTIHPSADRCQRHKLSCPIRLSIHPNRDPFNLPKAAHGGKNQTLPTVTGSLAGPVNPLYTRNTWQALV